MGKKNLKGMAEQYAEKARLADRRSAEGLKGVPTQGEVSRSYEITGDAYVTEKNPKDALKNYQKAFEYAYNKKIKDRIETKMRKAQPLPDSKKSKRKKGGLERRLGFATLAIATLVIALFFVSFNLTGYVIGKLAQNHLTLLGISLFILGLIFAFFYFRKKK